MWFSLVLTGMGACFYDRPAPKLYPLPFWKLIHHLIMYMWWLASEHWKFEQPLILVVMFVDGTGLIHSAAPPPPV